MDPKGKVALVTGGAMGIGFAICKELLKSGVKNVVICDLDKTKGELAAKSLNDEYGKDGVLFVKTDVTIASEFDEAFKKALTIFDGVDIVVNNAGIANEKQWEKEIDINLTGMIRGSLLAFHHMGKNKGGRGGVIINMASLAGVTPSPLIPMYSATKHGVVAFSRSLGDDYHYNITGVRVMVLCPGLTTTVLYAETSNNIYEERWAADWNRICPTVTQQGPEYVAKGVVQMIQNAKSGTVWVSKECKPIYEVTLELKEVH